ncbi:MAG: hypothetical protein JWQ90_2110 [Hydrocarboniphaga sp.]|uniref:hypothetical protein n=1 Tax=Hydrocarboniphaga sp. TaxID=2033016 RepID=UPI0026029AB8|nr:hypothetical protein [Hydrocarboniphaga sp.]MDB5969660.1 hypothetical protein [Hydrocarboniphaga sp.]
MRNPIVGWLAAGLACACVLGIFYGFIFTHPNLAENLVSIISGVALGSLVRAGVQGRFRRDDKRE